MSEPIKHEEEAAQVKIPEELGHLLDVPFKIAVEIGRRRMKVREILQLHRDSIVELPRSAGENIDIYVNGKLVALGEVIELEGNAGVRITDFHVQL